MTEEYEVEIEINTGPSFHEKARGIVKSELDEALTLFDNKDMKGYTKLISQIHLNAMTSFLYASARTNPILYLTMVKDYCKSLELDFMGNLKILKGGE